jgi:outer membrane protein assembly factor BamB
LIYRFFLFVLAAAAIAGCMGDDSTQEPPVPPRKPPPQPTTAPPAGTVGFVRVLDGDTKRPVRGAVVRVGDTTARADNRGVALVDVEAPEHVLARLTASGYIPRRVTVPLREGDPHTVQLWRRNLQWPLYGATQARTQAHPAIKLRPPFRVVWSRTMRSLVEFPASVWEGVAYITTGGGKLIAISMRNGHILWQTRIGTRAASTPAVDAPRGQLVATTKEPGRVTIVAMKTGKIRWRHAIGRSEPSPVIGRGVAYLADERGRVYALDLERRKMRWVFSGGAKITSSPALAGRRLFIGDYAGRVFALDTRSGRRLWTGNGGPHIYGTVAVARGLVFAPSVSSGLSALSARTGALRWRIPVGAYVYSSPAYYRGRVYFGSYSGVVYCAAARSGRILWRRSTGGSVSGALVVVAGVVYAGSFNYRITAWNWRTGRTLWRFPDGRYVPVSGNGGRLLMHGPRELSAVVPKRRR